MQAMTNDRKPAKSVVVRSSKKETDFRINSMPESVSDFARYPTRGKKRKCTIITAVVFLALALAIACIADSYHKINEGYVGIYFRHGALQDRVTEPGVHLMRPFIDDYTEVKIRPETYKMDPVPAITKDGIRNTFNEINVITMVKRDKLVFMAKKLGIAFKKSLVFDRIKEDLR